VAASPAVPGTTAADEPEAVPMSDRIEELTAKLVVNAVTGTHGQSAFKEREIRQRLVPQLRAAERDEFEHLLGCLWLYIDWPFVTSQLTTPQKERFADAVDAYWSRVNKADGEEHIPVERWWR